MARVEQQHQIILLIEPSLSRSKCPRVSVHVMSAHGGEPAIGIKVTIQPNDDGIGLSLTSTLSHHSCVKLSLMITI